MKAKMYLCRTINAGALLSFLLSIACVSQHPACPVHEHSHDATLTDTTSSSSHGSVVSHESLKSFENNGNVLVGIATKRMGAQNFEVWRTSVAPGSATPPHRHATEEVFIFLSGRGRATIGEQTVEFSAPATVIAPAGIEHQFFNSGDTPTDAIVIVGVGSAIYDHAGKEMTLPWRK